MKHVWLVSLLANLQVFSFVRAEPKWADVTAGQLVELRLVSATTLVPETLNVDDKYLRLDVQTQIEARPSAAGVHWLFASLVHAPNTNTLHLDEPIVSALKSWFDQAKWVDTLDARMMGITPEGVAVVRDDAENRHVWIIEYWKTAVRLRVGYNCGQGFYQVLPHSKVAAITDEKTRNLLLPQLTATPASGPRGERKQAFPEPKGDNGRAQQPKK
jgi:hypothetical protein